MTTVTFEDRGGKTLLTFHELYPSKEALDEAMAGSAAGLAHAAGSAGRTASDDRGVAASGTERAARMSGPPFRCRLSSTRYVGSGDTLVQ